MPRVPPEMIAALENAIKNIGVRLGRVAETEIKPGIGVRPGKIALEAGTEAATRATRVKEYQPLAEKAKQLGRLAGAFTRNEPALDAEARSTFADARAMYQSAEEKARLDVEDAVTRHITSDPAAKASVLSDYMTTAHEIAIHPIRVKRLREARGDVGARFIDDYTAPVHPGGVNIGQLTRNMAQIANVVKADPEIQLAHSGARQMLDGMFKDMVDRGYLSTERYVHEYTPIEKLELVTGTLGVTPTQKAGGTVTKAMRGLTAEGQALRETDVLRTLTQTRAAYYRKLAEDDLVAKIINNPKYNVTDQFQPNQMIPKGLSIYRPGQGMPGYGKRASAEEFADGFINAVAPDAPEFLPGDYVMPTEMAEALSKFRPQRLSKRAQTFADLGNRVARMWTVYNPANTAVNLPGDIIVSTISHESAKDALGFLRILGTTRPWKEAINVGRGARSELADQFRRNVGGSTLINDISGVPVPSEFSRFYQKPVKGLGKVADTMKRIRYGTEAVPRLAEMILQKQKGATEDEAARAARKISLEYGAGAPDVARNPYARFLSTFIQFYGLATERTMQLLSKKGPAAVLAAVPTGFMLWNYQNDEYAKAENSLADWERSTMHFIAPGPDGKPQVDDHGKPVVLRVRWWIPEQVLQNFGLGNLPSRVRRVVDGRDTPSEFAASIPQQAGQSISRLGGVLETAREASSGLTSQGKEIEGVKGVARLFSPQFRQVDDAIRVARNEGVGKGMSKLVASTLGVSRAVVRTRGSVLLDADIQESKRRLKLYVSRMKFARSNKQPADAKDAQMAIINERKNLQRLRSLQHRED